MGERPSWVRVAEEFGVKVTRPATDSEVRDRRKSELLKLLKLPKPCRNVLSRFTDSKGLLVRAQSTVAGQGISSLLGRGGLAGARAAELRLKCPPPSAPANMVLKGKKEAFAPSPGLPPGGIFL